MKLAEKKDQYGEWCKKSLCPFPGISYPIHEYTQPALNILRFLAEINYSPSLYDLAHGVKISRQRTPGQPKQHEIKPLRDADTKIGYSYSLIHRSIGELVNDNLVSETTVMTGSRGKKVLDITLQGLLLFIKAWKQLDNVAFSSIKTAIKHHSDLLHISNQLDRLESIVGDQLYQVFIRLCEIPYRKVHLTIKDQEIDFISYIPNIGGLTGALIMGNISERKEFSRKNPVLRLIYESYDLARIFQAYLALKDLFSWYSGLLDESQNEEWNSERISAFFTQREVKDYSIFHNRQYQDFFSDGFDLGCVIIGALLEEFVFVRKVQQPGSEFGVRKNGIEINFL